MDGPHSGEQATVRSDPTCGRRSLKRAEIATAKIGEIRPQVTLDRLSFTP
jgi:hypothetical protein